VAVGVVLFAAGAVRWSMGRTDGSAGGGER
jgi:hypothetical protein